MKGGRYIDKEVSKIRTENIMEIDPSSGEKTEGINKQHEEHKVRVILHQGEWLYEEEYKERNIRGKEEHTKFNPNHKGDIIIEMNVKSESKLKTRILNNMKIANFLFSKNIKIDCMKITNFNKNKIKFTNIIEANRCLFGIQAGYEDRRSQNSNKSIEKKRGAD